MHRVLRKNSYSTELLAATNFIVPGVASSIIIMYKAGFTAYTHG